MSTQVNQTPPQWEEQIEKFIKKVKRRKEDWDYHVVRVRKDGKIEADNVFALKRNDLYAIFEIPSSESFYYVLMKVVDVSKSPCGRVLAVVKSDPEGMEEGVPIVIASRDFDEAVKQVKQLYEGALARGDNDAIAYELLYRYLDALRC